MLDKDNIEKKMKEINAGLTSFNNFMIEQAEINDYEELIKIVIDQLDGFLRPGATIFTEYDRDTKALVVKDLKAKQVNIDLALKIGGRKILSTVTPVDKEMYQAMIVDRVVAVSTLHELTGGAIPEFLSTSLGKALNIKSYLVLSYLVDSHLFGTTVVMLREQPQDYIMELLKKYAHFTAVSLKRISSGQALIESEQKYQQLVENISDVIWTIDQDFVTTYVTPSIKIITGETVEEHMSKSIDQRYPHDSLVKIYKIMEEEFEKEKDPTIDKNRSCIFEVEHYTTDGGTVWVSINTSFVRDNEGKIIGLQGVLRDITERKMIEDALRKSEEMYRKIAENVTDVVWITDMNLSVTYISPSIEKLLGITAEEIKNRTIEELFTPGSIENIYSMFKEELEQEKEPSSDKKRTRVIEAETYKADGNVIWVSMHISASRDSKDNVIGFQGISRDITEQKKAEDKIRYMSYHDQLTGLYNRHYFVQCEKELNETPVLSVITTDVNGLKLINDTYGHEFGDELLKKYAVLLKESFKKSDLIFRWGGDEFIVILKDTDEATSWKHCKSLVKHCEKTYIKDIPLSISLGTSSKSQGEDLKKALTEAENKMYKQKLNESKSSKNKIIKTLLQTLSEYGFETKEHIDRMISIGRLFGERLKLTPSDLSKLDTLIMLHDIGKINIDSNILLKDSDLTTEEWEEIMKHPEHGYRITSTAEEFAYVAQDILHHHERWDGQGYPMGVSGDKIPYFSRVMNLVDSYEVMSSGRPYRNKMLTKEIIDNIECCSGQQFDPELAKVFIACLREGLF